MTLRTIGNDQGDTLDFLECDLCAHAVNAYSDEAWEWRWYEGGEACVCLLCVERAEGEVIAEEFGVDGLATIRGNMARMWAELDGPGLDLS